MALYHATFGNRLDSIKKNGLLVGSEKVWDISNSDCIYLSPDSDVAYSFCEVAMQDYEGDIEELGGIYLIEIDESLLDNSKLYLDRNIRDNLESDSDDDELCYLEYHGDIDTSKFVGIERVYY